MTRAGLLVVTCEFGWGSRGKSQLILDELPGIEVTSSEDAARAALVINDSVTANRLAESGLPVVYVDSLPYLWSTEAEVPRPRNNIHYCAQKYPLEKVPVGVPLRNRSGIHWVNPIVRPGRARRGGRGVVVSVGGLRCQYMDGRNYVALVLLPLAEALLANGRSVAAVCGNLDDRSCRRLASMFPGTASIGPRQPDEFEQLLENADLLITAPGSTTIFQALALGLSTLLLPPQNVSQYVNAEVFTGLCTGAVRWPNTLPGPKTRDQREQLASIRRAMSNALRAPTVAAETAAAIAAAVHDLPLAVTRQTFVEIPSGAAQVAQIVRRVMQL